MLSLCVVCLQSVYCRCACALLLALFQGCLSFTLACVAAMASFLPVDPCGHVGGSCGPGSSQWLPQNPQEAPDQGGPCSHEWGLALAEVSRRLVMHTPWQACHPQSLVLAGVIAAGAQFRSSALAVHGVLPVTTACWPFLPSQLPAVAGVGHKNTHLCCLLFPAAACHLLLSRRTGWLLWVTSTCCLQTSRTFTTFWPAAATQRCPAQLTSRSTSCRCS